MQSFKETRFPEDISYGSSGGPGYSTDIITVNSGFEQRNINWSQSRAKYNIAHGVKNKEQLEELIKFFRIMKGKAFGFRFKDWTDYQAINQRINHIDSDRKIFQLSKSYNIDQFIENRIIKKPVENSVKIYINNIIYENIEIDYSNGYVKFDKQIAIDYMVTADFEFDVPVRFNTDSLSAVIENYGTYSWYDIELIEVKI